MRPTVLIATVCLLGLTCGVAAADAEAPDTPPVKAQDRYFNTPDEMVPFRAQEPYLRFFLDSHRTGLEYTGPGRDLPEPANLASVKIGYLGPTHRVVADDRGDMMPGQYSQIGLAMEQGARLALEEANTAGGWRGRLPYELIARNDPVVQVDLGWMWGPFASNAVDLCYEDKVWAIFGTISGENSHILIRIALKAEVPVVNSADTDPTLPETRIPWVFRVISDDRIANYTLAKYAYEVLDLKSVAILRYNGRYGRVGVKEFRDASRRLGHPVPIELKFVNGETDFSQRLDWIQRVSPDGILLWGNTDECATIVRQIRNRGMKQVVLASDRVIGDRFLELAGEAAEGVVAADVWDPTIENPLFDAFKKRYCERWGSEPDAYAAHAYDGMAMLLRAIDEAGLNRARIRDALEQRRRNVFHGVTGEILLNDIYTDAGPIALAVVRDGAWLSMSATAAGVDLPATMAVAGAGE